jgi:hypothetical protein
MAGGGNVEEFSERVSGPPDVVLDLLTELIREVPGARVDGERFDYTSQVPGYRFQTVWVVGRFKVHDDGVQAVGVVEPSPSNRAASWFAAAMIAAGGAWRFAADPQISLVLAVLVGVAGVAAFDVGLRPGLVRGGAARVRSLIARAQRLSDVYRGEIRR